MHTRLFIPGPVEVAKPVLQAMSNPMIGHREKRFADLYNRIQPKLQQVLKTKNPVFLGTCSATGIMEAAARNGVAKRVLNLTCGAFSERWHDICNANGIPATKISTDWGLCNKASVLDSALASGQYDAVTVVHNETSTGVMNPLGDISRVVKKYPNVLLLVDAVSSMAGVDIPVDDLGLDVCLAGTQKCWAVPPGMTIFSVSPKILEKAKSIPHRGYYTDFLDMLANHNKGNTPSTPSISHMYAIDAQCDRILAEGIETRFARHAEMATICRAWGRERFGLFPEAGHESLTLTVFKNPGIDIKGLNAFLKERGAVISDGYGKIKDSTFRIAHMGETTTKELKEVLGWIDEYLNGK